MVKRKIVIALILFIPYFQSCKGQIALDLADSIWEKKGLYCTDSLHLYSNGKYVEYYCEFQEYMKGDYSFDEDTLTLVEYQLSSEIVTNSPEPRPTFVWKYILLKSGELQKVYYEDIINKEKSFF